MAGRPVDRALEAAFVHHPSLRRRLARLPVRSHAPGVLPPTEDRAVFQLSLRITLLLIILPRLFHGVDQRAGSDVNHGARDDGEHRDPGDEMLKQHDTYNNMAEMAAFDVAGCVPLRGKARVACI